MHTFLAHIECEIIHYFFLFSFLDVSVKVFQSDIYNTVFISNMCVHTFSYFNFYIMQSFSVLHLY